MENEPAGNRKSTSPSLDDLLRQGERSRQDERSKRHHGESRHISGRGPSTTADSKPSSGAPKSLDELVGQPIGPASRAESLGNSRSGASERTPSLDDLLRNAGAPDLGRARLRTPQGEPRRSARLPADSDLATLAATARNGGGGIGTDRGKAEQSSPSLNATLTAGQSSAEAPRAGYLGRRGTPIAAALVATAIVVALTFQLFSETVKSLPRGETPLAKELMKVVAAVESYEAEHKALPTTLSELDAFPKGAVEMDITEYDLILVPPKVELFLEPDEEEYYVIARYGDEAWLYAPHFKVPLSKVPARD